MNIFQAFTEGKLCNGMLFYYSGYLSQNVIDAMGDSLRNRLQNQGTKGATSRKVFSTFIEMAQNILNYGVDADRAEGRAQYAHGGVAIGLVDERFFIFCGNLIEQTHVQRVRAKLEAIRTMSPEEIKQTYKQQLRNDEHEDEDELSKGAGLGFLTVARDASEPIEFCFIEHEQHPEKVGFYLKAVI